MLLPKRAKIIEVGLRDGLQNESVYVATEDKLSLLHSLQQAGIAEFEASAFVHPRWIPALADAEDFFGGIQRKADVRYLALVPNSRGFERAVRAGVDGVTLVVSASDSHNRSNLNRPTFETLDDFAGLTQATKEAGVEVRGSVATAFGCPFEGTVPVKRVLDVVERFSSFGVRRVSLCDTIGVAYPNQVQELFSSVLERFPDIHFEAHFHDTYGRGLANVFAALQAGIQTFDSSIAGLGGCPYAPGATGNVATEDLVAMLSGMGIETGLDQELLFESVRLAEKLVGKPSAGRVMKAVACRNQH